MLSHFEPVLIATCLIALSCAPGWAQEVNRARDLALRSPYLEPPLGGARQITIRTRLGGDDAAGGEVVLDPNACRLDEYGDPAGCTRQAVRRVPIQLQLLKPSDPVRERPLLYRIAGDGLPRELFLVVPLRESGPYRLLERDQQSTTRVVVLEPIGAKEEPVQNHPRERDRAGRARYFAQQVPGAVIITAEGEFPSAGYKAVFRKSAIAVFPPEFSLKWVPPEGAAAQVITPFRESTYFKAVEPVESVTVHDAGGRQVVPVTQVPEPQAGIQ